MASDKRQCFCGDGGNISCYQLQSEPDTSNNNSRSSHHQEFIIKYYSIMNCCYH